MSPDTDDFDSDTIAGGPLSPPRLEGQIVSLLTTDGSTTESEMGARVDAGALCGMRCAGDARMHAVFFGLKRAHHGVLRVVRTTLGRLGLTAARFDLLYALSRHGRSGAMQSALRRALGVSAPTVSRMLKSLERLGWVAGRRTLGDRRQRHIELTRVGRKCIRRARRIMIDAGQAQLVVDTALGGARWYDQEHCFWATCALDSILGEVRRAFRDSATLHYPWHPDD